MKKHLLFGLALFAAITAFPQIGRKPTLASGIENTAEKIAQRFASRNSPMEANPTSGALSQTTITAEAEPEQSFRTSNTSTLVTTWKTVSGSMNVYGVLVESSKPLQYNEDLNAVSFVHRKSAYYTPSPAPTSTTAESGVIVAMVSQNWGATWDSTAVWNNNNNWARYPQGGIYNPLGGNNINNAYIVATGPITQISAALGWTGNYFASKQLGAANYNNVASTVTNAQQFFPSISPSLGSGKTDFARLDFQSLDNGNLVALGSIYQDANGTTAATQGYRGARLIKGAFNSGVFTWSGDSIIPAVTNSGGTSDLIARPSMAWSEDGSVGYIVHIGCSPGTSGNNVGFQPIVWKSVNGSPWAKVNSIDFNSPSMSSVLNHVLSPNTNTNVAIPFFDFTMGIGTTVDKDNRLHIAASVRGTFSSDPDSLGFTFSFNNYDGESYTYRHSPGLRPYLYDFIGDGVSTWSVVTVDSLSSEGPGTRPTDNGFESNPWDATGGDANADKVECDPRIQLSRTPDGKYVVYTFAESDTTVTSNPVSGVSGVKWNQFPNVKARMMDVASQSVHTLEINVTKPPTTGPDTYTNIISPTSVRSRAFFHYASPKCALASTVVTSTGPAFYLPMTVTSNAGLQQLSPVVHRYISAVLDFGGVFKSTSTGTVNGISENSIASSTNSYIYPNPAYGKVVLAIDLKNSSNVEVTLTNIMGQVLKSTKIEAYSGANNIDVDVNGLAKGIYMVSVNVDGASSTKKLIIE
jgi:hypothetical protein